ncbi:PQQ-like beta-propeller repeat protein [Candidatus Pelagibacter sp.]|nr:PQQ-like beta-propeller repeat protein [Candidatus Pelagibacter sp.]
MNKLLLLSTILLLLNACSLDTKSGIWTEKKDLVLENTKSTQVFVKEEILEKEFNPNLEVSLESKIINNSFANNLTNNNGRINYDGELKKVSKYKFSKIANFEYYEPELIFDNNNIVFFDKTGSIIKFDSNSDIIWKTNYYNKQEKKLRPVVTFAKNSETLIIADNISKYYAIDLKNGDLLWSRYNQSPFNSQIKTYKDMFFIIDFNNVLRCISIKDGVELWSVKGNNTFIKSQKKLSIIIIDEALYYNDSVGNITAINIKDGNMLWQTPTQNSTIFEDTFLLRASNIIANQEMIVFSNNKNEFYSLDLITGNLRWKQNINSSLQSTIINDLIFSITNEGYLVIINAKNGNIIKITDVFSSINKKKRLKINPVGFIVAKNNIYLTVDNGRLFVIDIKNGKTKSIIKIDNNKISKPFILNQNMFLIKDDSIIKLD